TCIGRLGVDGCGYEQHLEGMKRALDGSRPENAGFLRDNAYLAVVILADEDDCSAKDTKVFDSGDLLGDASVASLLGPSGSYRCTEFGVKCDGMNLGRGAVKDYTSCVPRTDSYLADPMSYVSFLRTLKGGDPSRVLVAVVAGPPTPFGVGICTDARAMFTCLDHSCMGVLNGRQNVGDPGVRLNAFEKAFTIHGYFTNVCDNHYEMVLNDIGKLIASVVGNRCLNGDIDADDINPTVPGLQLNCEVSAVPNAGGPAAELVIPRCGMKDANTPDLTTTPCWWARVDTTACANTATHTAIFIERNNASPPVGTHVAARCATKEI